MRLRKLGLLAVAALLLAGCSAGTDGAATSWTSSADATTSTHAPAPSIAPTASVRDQVSAWADEIHPDVLALDSANAAISAGAADDDTVAILAGCRSLQNVATRLLAARHAPQLEVDQEFRLSISSYLDEAGSCIALDFTSMLASRDAGDEHMLKMSKIELD